MQAIDTMETKNHINKNCNELCSLSLIKETMHLLSGKWKMQIIAFLLENGKTRFMELQRAMGGITARVLSKDLQELLQNQIVSRVEIKPKLIAVEYELTEYGKTLKDILNSIIRWGTINCK